MSLGILLRAACKLRSRLRSKLAAHLLSGLPGVDIRGQIVIAPGVRFSVVAGGRLSIGPYVSFAERSTIFAAPGVLSIGKATHIGIGTVIAARQLISIGDDCLIAEYVTIRDQDHAYTDRGPTAQNGFRTAPINIGNNVWIGAKATITKGVSIGDNAVIGANAVVTADIPANSVAVGIPARVIKTMMATDETSSRHRHARHWRSGADAGQHAPGTGAERP